ncbi:MAG: hypothetical protein EOO60_00480 [Hymenobacter sp.]|nr:MAG: hypothetical protein EOO60_00480 [Hymenobacter sp.]
MLPHRPKALFSKGLSFWGDQAQTHEQQASSIAGSVDLARSCVIVATTSGALLEDEDASKGETLRLASKRCLYVHLDG